MCAGAGTSVGIRLFLKSSTTRRAYLLMDPSCRSFPKIPALSSLRPNAESEDALAAALLPDAGDASGPNDFGDGVVEDELLSELTDNPGTTRGTKLVCLANNVSPILGSSWLLTADTLIAIGQLAFLRVVARLRTDSSHERTLVPPRECALLRLQSTLRLGFWTFLLSKTPLSFALFCSSCVSMLLNRLRILALLVSLK